MTKPDQTSARDPWERWERGLGRNAANHQPLTPLTFLARATQAYPKHTAVVHGAQTYDYQTLSARCHRLASALKRRGVGPGDVVSVLAPNVPCALEAHYGVPMAGAVLHAMNVRLDAPTIAYMLDHAQTKLWI